MSNTTNLNLFKHDNPSTNTNPFNIEASLNENWDKIDAFAGDTNTAITNNENNIEALQVENARLKQTLLTTKGNGETITLNKTAEMEFVVPPLPIGNTVQDGEPTPTNPVEVQVVKGDVEVKVENGNLVNEDNLEIFNNNRYVKFNDNYYINAEPNTAYTLSIEVFAGDGKFVEYDENNNTLKETSIYSILTNGYVTITTTANTKKIKFYAQMYNSVPSETPTKYTAKCMLKKGSTATSYTPHQEQKLPLYLPVENLFDKNSMTWVRNNNDIYTDGNNAATNRIRTSNLIKLKVGETYTISGLPEQIQFGRVKFYEDTTSTKVSSYIETTTFTVPVNAPYAIFQFNGTGFTDETNTLMANANIMLEQGSKANAYTPYGTNPIELCKIGNYQDYFYRDNNKGKWYLHKVFNKMIFDGVTNALTYNKQGGIINTGFKLINNILIPSNNSTKAKILTNYFIINSVNFLTEQLSTGAAVRTDKIFFLSFGTNENFDTTEKINNWLTTHNVILYYVSNDPTDIEITDTTLISQLEAINNAISYYEQTNISGTSSGISPLFDVEAYQSTKLLLENALDRLELLES